MLNNKSSISRSCWVLVLTASVFLGVFAAYPQLKLRYNTGSQWQGHYAYNDIDEAAYAAYLKALIDGRPRKNDPYTGRDDTESTPQPESLFSIQFAAPYLVAIPARILGISAPTAMTMAGILAGFFSAFICFWLIRDLSGNDILAFSGALAVLCGGALIAGEGAIGEILGTGFSYPYFPFLRRYVPAVPFPFFIFLLFAVRRMLVSDQRKMRIMWCVAASLSFSFLVFSYFYIWTTAAAWLFCLTIAILITRTDGWKRDIAGLAALGLSCLVPLAVYGLMLSRRTGTMDNVQLLVNTHAPDFGRVPLYVGLVAVVVAAALLLTKKAKAESLTVVFTIVTGVVPVVLFNQQVITGQSLQPIHYQVFIGNYVAGLAVVFAVGLLINAVRGKLEKTTGIILGAVSVIAIAWGFVECHYTVRVLDGANIARDRGFAVGEILKKEALKSKDPFRETILSPSSIQSDDSPTLAPQNVLWARHQHVFAGLNWQESKERFYKHLYYRDLGPEWLDHQLKNRNFVAMIALFGWGRHTDRLSTDAKPLKYSEIEQEVELFRKFTEEFDADQATTPALNYYVVPVNDGGTTVNLDRWYEKELVADTDYYKIYKLKVK